MSGPDICEDMRREQEKRARQPRSGSQNKKWHAMLRDIAEQAEFAGQKWSEDDWKVLILSGHAAEAGKGIGKIVTGLAGELVQLRERSSWMNRERMQSLIEYTYAEGTERGVRFRAPEWYD